MEVRNVIIFLCDYSSRSFLDLSISHVLVGGYNISSVKVGIRTRGFNFVPIRFDPILFS